MKSSLAALLPLALLLGACNPGTPEGVVRLESLVTEDSMVDNWDAHTYEGLATVTGADRDWVVSVDLGEGASESVTLHLPGASDLSALDQQALVVDLENVWGSNPRDLAISTPAGDEPGEALFLVQVHDRGFASERFGENFVAYGAEKGEAAVTDDYGDWKVMYHDVVFQTDNGEVSATPGTPVDLTLQGDRWRVVVHTAFEVTKTPDALPGCGGGLADTLSFEMRKVQDSPDLTPLTPGDGHLAGEYSCE